MDGRSMVLVGVVCLAAGSSGCLAEVEPSYWGEEDGIEGPLCGRDALCDAGCRYDPDCEGPGCGADGLCREQCAAGTDPDCGDDPAGCGEDLRCDPACEDDPDCEGMDCSADGACGSACPEGWDPDCAVPVCISDRVCETRCPEGTDPDCGTTACGSDRWCNPGCPAGADPDCSSDCGVADGPCCSTGPACEAGAECVLVDGWGEMCLALCSPTACAYGASAGSCLDVLGTAACFGPELEPGSCVEGTTGCTTGYGVSTGTVCIGDGFETYCLEGCAVSPTGCPPTHACIPFAGEESLGACILAA
jgi:hypothetical protein